MQRESDYRDPMDVTTEQRITWMEQTLDEVLQDVSGNPRINKKTNESTTQTEEEETIMAGKQERKKRTTCTPITNFFTNNIAAYFDKYLT